MTDAQIRRMAKQLRAGADGYETLKRAVNRAMIGDVHQIALVRENMERLHRELEELASMYEASRPAWLREVKP